MMTRVFLLGLSVMDHVLAREAMVHAARFSSAPILVIRDPEPEMPKAEAFPQLDMVAATTNATHWETKMWQARRDYAERHAPNQPFYAAVAGRKPNQRRKS